MTGLRVGFMGTPDFALEALKALHGSAHEVVCVYTQPPRPKGRGHQVQPSPVHEYAEENGIPVFTPTSLKTEDVQEEFSAQRLDIAVVVAYGLILPKPVLNAPKYGCLNIHASLLPRWRGASPIQQAIWQGDEETGVAIMQMDEGLDTGPVVAVQATEITRQTTTTSLHDELSLMGGTLVLSVLDQLANGEALEARPQDEDQATYASLLKKEDGLIDWQQSAKQIDQQIRALNPWPGVWAILDEQRFKILEAQPVESGKAEPGAILDQEGHIQCGQGTALKILKLQPSGKQAMDFTAAMNGGYVSVGDAFS